MTVNYPARGRQHLGSHTVKWNSNFMDTQEYEKEMTFLAGSEKCLSSATFAFTLGQILQPLPSTPQQSNIRGSVMLEGPSLPLAFITCSLAFVHQTISPCLGQCSALLES